MRQHTSVEASGGELICDECSSDAGVRVEWPCRDVLLHQMQKVRKFRDQLTREQGIGPIMHYRDYVVRVLDNALDEEDQ